MTFHNGRKRAIAHAVPARPISPFELDMWWMEPGPWAVRYYAACLYVQRWGYIPRNWDWAAKSLPVSAPLLFDGVNRSVRDKSPAVSPPSKPMDEVPNPKLSVRLNDGFSPPDGNLLNRHRRAGRATMSPSPSPSTNYGESAPRSRSDEKGGKRPEGRQGAFQPRGGNRDRTPNEGADSPPRPRPTPSPPSSWSQGWSRRGKWKMNEGKFFSFRTKHQVSV